MAGSASGTATRPFLSSRAACCRSSATNPDRCTTWPLACDVFPGGAPRIRSSLPAASWRAIRSLATILERHHASAAFRAALERAVAGFAGAEGRERLEALLDAQPYRLVHWRRAGEDLNYRRFFEINDLIGVRVEDPLVFAATHARVLGWVADGTISGLRVDHIDGLLDPAAYLDALAAAVAAARPTGARAPRSWSRRSSPPGKACAATGRSLAPPGTSS